MLAPMLVARARRAELIAEMPYAELQCMLDDPPGFRNYWSAEYLARVPGRGASTLYCASADDMIVPVAVAARAVPGRRRGGARGRRLADAVAATRRGASTPSGSGSDPADDERGIAVGAGHPRRPEAVGDRGRLPELHRRRGRGPGRGRLRRRRTTSGWRRSRPSTTPDNVLPPPPRDQAADSGVSPLQRLDSPLRPRLFRPQNPRRIPTNVRLQGRSRRRRNDGRRDRPGDRRRRHPRRPQGHQAGVRRRPASTRPARSPRASSTASSRRRS